MPAQLAAAPQETPASPVQTVVSIPAKPVSPRRKLAYVLCVVLLAVLGSVAWWWFHRPAPAYKVEDPGIYPNPVLSADGKTYKFSFIDADGSVLIQPGEWDEVCHAYIMGQQVAFNEGLCEVKKDGKWSYIDTGGHLVIPYQFDDAGPFVEGLAGVKLGGQWGFIDKTGQYAINPQFSGVYNFQEGLAAVQSAELWGFINKTGTYVIKPRFRSVSPNGFSNGLACVCVGYKCGFIDHSGKFIIQPQFDNVSAFSEGLASVVINQKMGFINTAGKLVINPQFDNSTGFSGGLAVVWFSGLSGTINKQGKYVVNPGQYKFGDTPGNLVIASSGDGFGLMTWDGKWVLKPSTVFEPTQMVIGKVIYCKIGGQIVPVSMSGKVLAGPYKGTALDTLAQDFENEKRALVSLRALVGAEARYSTAYPAKGFTASLDKLGPSQGTPNENHAGLIDAPLATGSKDGYQFTVTIPAGTSIRGINFNYFLVAKPAAGHIGRSFCADSSGTPHFALQGEECMVKSPTP
jgi:hypothetical protein